jgi:hypothetical protein
MLLKRLKAELDPEHRWNKAEYAFSKYFSDLTFGTRNPVPLRALALRVGGQGARSRRRRT